MSYKTLSYEENQGVGVLKFNRPESLNALNRPLLEELNTFLDKIRHDDEVRCLIFTGQGDKAFIAGADIKEISLLKGQEPQKFAKYGQDTLLKIEQLPCPVIAAVNGFALGGGLEVALACDFIWASEKAKLGLPEVSLGIIPGYGGTQRLSRWVGVGRAREMIFSGQFYDAKTAFEFGLVQKVLAPDALLPECLKLASLIASRGPLAVGAAKKSINQGFDCDLVAGLDLEAHEFTLLFGSRDQIEGTRAFIEKRSPQFTGK
ncbi:MAG: enoyl-CoA hydratase-related protein [Pseudomonadota bacterium]|nr:enoyl-CoA hydratase-related protein [Pseudomonadota bacterium]